MYTRERHASPPGIHVFKEQSDDIQPPFAPKTAPAYHTRLDSNTVSLTYAITTVHLVPVINYITYFIYFCLHQLRWNKVTTDLMKMTSIIVLYADRTLFPIPRLDLAPLVNTTPVQVPDLLAVAVQDLYL